MRNRWLVAAFYLSASICGIVAVLVAAVLVWQLLPPLIIGLILDTLIVL
jgi:hypothetical protein